MQQMKSKNDYIGRRNILKTIGASTVGLTGLSSMAAGKLSGEKIHGQARRILEETGDVQKRENYLRNHGVKVDSKEKTYHVPELQPEDSDGIGTYYLDKNDLRIYFGMSEVSSGKWDVFLQWHWKNQDIDDWGEDPKDIVGFSWGGSEYEIRSQEQWTSNRVATYKIDPFGAERGCSFTFRDQYGDDGDIYWAESFVHFDKYNGNRRQIKAEYVHTYGGIWDDVSIGFPQVITVTWNDEPEQWSTSRQHDGDFLLISPQNSTV